MLLIVERLFTYLSDKNNWISRSDSTIIFTGVKVIRNIKFGIYHTMAYINWRLMVSPYIFDL